MTVPSSRDGSYRLCDQDAIARANREIHRRCGAEISILWDDGKAVIAESIHKVTAWNGLGSVSYLIASEDLAKPGPAYNRFLDEFCSAVNSRLSLRL